MSRFFQASVRHGWHKRFLAMLVLIPWLFMIPSMGCKGKGENPAPPAVKKKVLPVRKDASKTPPDAPPVAEVGQSEAPSVAAGSSVSEPENKDALPEAEVAAETPRDPFRSFVRVNVEKEKPQGTPVRMLAPLQRYSLDQLRVVGVIEGQGVNKALVEDDVGKGYVVGKGDLVGNQGGSVAAIESDRIIIEEAYVDVIGNQKTRQITKKLYTPDQGNQQ